MEGVSDVGFRKICLKTGADLTFTEMIRADAFVRNNKATLELIDTYEFPAGVQFLVSKSDILKKTLNIIAEKKKEKDEKYLNISCIDLNFGCPSKEIISAGNGPALLKRINKMKEILTVLKECSPVPCGIKIRLGLNKKEKENKVYLKVLDIVNSLKLDWITVHPKTADQRSLDPVDMNALQEIINNSEIPVIGNGFVESGKTAKEFFDRGCHGVMIARAAVVNPWIFDEIKHYLRTGKEISIKKEYHKLLDEYLRTAKNYSSKQKYVEFHKRNFALKIKNDFSYHSPARIMTWI